ncbi:hypothetical protein HYT53_04495 [Candidatus Woesearchaeota archaeon]|nr:hypothetical protein [Candidatus Woesearchaeota archaeon]
MISRKGINIGNKKIGHVVGHFNHIEGLLKHLLTFYIEPSERKKEFVEEILLNNSILNFSSKLKLFLNINQEEKWLNGRELDDFKKNIYFLSNVRNSFAHAETRIHIYTEHRKNRKPKIYYVVEKFENDGTCAWYSADELLKEFNKKYIPVENTLIRILHQLDKKFGNIIESASI